MTQRPVVHITIACVLLAVGLAQCVPAEKPLQANGGVLDLRGVPLDRSVSLDGEWRFHWSEFMDPTLADEEAHSSGELLRVPGAWNGRTIDGEEIAGQGYGTLSLTVHVGDRDEALAVYAPTMHSSYVLYINGKELYRNGIVGKSEDESVAQYLPDTVALPDAQTYEIVLHIANFHHRKGGTWTAIALGKRENLESYYERKMHLDFAVLGALVLMGVYHLVLYTLRKRDTSPLFFGLLCLLLATRSLTIGQHYLVQYFPNIPWDHYVRLQYTTFFCALPVGASFMRAMFPNELPRFFVIPIYVFSGLLIAPVLVAPVRIFSYTVILFQAVMPALGMVLVVLLCMAIYRRRDMATPMLVGWLLLFGSVINDILYNSEVIASIHLAPFGLLAFIAVQSGLLSVRFARAFHTAEELSRHLEDRIAVRTHELEESTEQLRAAKIKAEESSRAKSEFLATMSHEVRTPLNSILGAAALLREDPRAEEREQQLAILQRAGERLLSLIDEVLDMSRIEAGMVSLENVEFDPASSCSDVVSILSSRARLKGISLEWHSASPFPERVVGDCARLEQILMNLLANAIKFTNEGGVILHAEAMPMNDSRTLLRFQVKDTGIGIPPEALESVFDSFVQVEQSSTRRFEGSGLGLSITRRLAELMGGRVYAESNPGQGSTFTIEIPFTTAIGKAPARRPTQPETHASAIPPGLRILLVDDNADNRYLIQAFLAKVDVDLSLATNGQEAVEMAESSSFDLILMDIQMPVMDGHEATRAIREIEKSEGRQPTTIVALTANASREAVQESRDAGCDDHMTKPIKKERLLVAISELVRKND